ncbi:MAG: putative rane protein [Hydrocarboniphaga sp.]|uniref:cellulose biosynthesis protein BcsG n=1 Tax=Hydrocarboniphaga sp. TaxID=2033016 RepID=UPI002613FAF8|nr:cellulose biosynthesis protein BcsG [Hydrocarboniphaga sp.]MDB5969535.1 putative rane protein [Hydrocarboniphaga sp.]
MGIWAWYFFGKLYLAAAGYIGLHVLANLAFAAALVLPLPRPWMRIARQVAALPLGVALLYYDSWLPSIQRTLSLTGNVKQFTLPYLAELLGRFVDLRVLAILIAICVIVAILGRKLRLSTFVFAGLLLVPLGIKLAALDWHPQLAAVNGAAAVTAPVAAATPEILEQELQAFYRKEEARRIVFPAAAASNAAPFDLVILHICSLAWDDMDYVGEREHPFLSSFDFQLPNFNTGASYSGPAAARLLQASCGQTPEDQLYKPRPPECLLVNGLQNAGFEAQLAMNHDGHFDDFIGLLSQRGGLHAPLLNHDGVAVRLHAFDGSPLYGDYDMLAHWWQQRLASPAPQVALYYNSITMHDGNTVDGVKLASGKQSYRYRLDQLFGDLQRFIDLVQSSGRRAVVVLVPEHGANVRGDRMQIAGLREIPSPAISLGPTAVRLLNLPQPPSGGPQRIEQPTALFGLVNLIQSLVRDNPFAATGSVDLAHYAAAVAQTEPSVAENERTVVMRHGKEYWLRSPDGSWQKYDAAR